MIKSWILWIIGGLALVTLAVIGGPSLLAPAPDTDTSSPPAHSNDSSDETPSETSRDASAGSAPTADSSIDVIVNGEPIPESRVDRAFRDLLKRYQTAYQREGRDFTSTLEGPSGRYQEIQIRFQAAQSAIQREVMEQQSERHGIQLSDSAVQSASQQRFQAFLDENSITEDQLVELYQDPQRQAITQRLLNIDDPSVQALKARFRRDARYELLADELAKAVLSDRDDLSTDEAEERFNDWLKQRVEASEIVYQDPLLRAHAMEKRISDAPTLEEKQTRVQETIGAYQLAKEQLDVDPTALDYIIGLLHNIRVNVSQQMKDQLLEQAGAGSSGSGSDANVSQLDQKIRESRREATQLLSPLNVNDEAQILEMIKADSGNPLYKYMYAQYLFNNVDGNRSTRVIQMLERALDLAPDYVDAHVLYGDVRMRQSYYADAVNHYRNALAGFDSDIEPQLKTTARRTVRHKLTEAYIAQAESIDPESADASALERRRQALDQATDQLEGLKADLGPSNPIYSEVLVHFGDVAMLREAYEQAQSHYREALEVDETASVLVKLGDAYRRNAQPTQADEAYRQALQTSSGFAPAHEGLARLYKAQGDSNQALEQFKMAFNSERLSYGERRRIALEALELNPNDVDMRLQLGDFYLGNNVYEGALKQYQAVVNQAPENVAAHIGIGRVHLERLHYGKALSAFRDALNANPTPEQAIDTYEWMVKTEQRRAGPGQPLPESGQQAIWQLAQLYVQSDQPNESFEQLLTLREDYPDFRPDDVQALMEQTKTSVGDDLPGQPAPNQGSEIIEPDADHGPYVTTPPTSGPHYVISADWGIHAEPIPNEVQVRNLAGGGVLIQYRPDASNELKTQLRDLVTELRGESGTHCRLILAPYEGLSTTIAVTAWARIDTMSEFDADRIRSFVSAHIGKGPEVGQVGCSRPNAVSSE